jgi:hypothetical protein
MPIDLDKSSEGAGGQSSGAGIMGGIAAIGNAVNDTMGFWKGVIDDYRDYKSGTSKQDIAKLSMRKILKDMELAGRGADLAERQYATDASQKNRQLGLAGIGALAEQRDKARMAARTSMFARDLAQVAQGRA